MKKRKTLGFMIPEIDGSYPTLLWMSAKRAAEEHDCNLIAYEGRILDYRPGIDRQHNIIYNFADKNRIDSLIIPTNFLFNRSSRDSMPEFFQHYANIPVVSIGEAVPGFSSILADNRYGMKCLINHLIKDHGFKRIAFIKGPLGNMEADARFESYIEALKENNIDIDQGIIFNSNFSSHSGYRIMREDIGSNINFEALICANDDLALGVLKAANELNVKIPRDFTLCGFDDVINARTITPALTTVRQPLEKIYSFAVETLLKEIAGYTPEEIKGERTSNSLSFRTFATEPVIRESCGCSCPKSHLDSLSDFYLRVIKNYKVHENMQTYSLDELFDNITEALKNYNIRSCFVSKYSDGMILFDDTFILPEDSQLIYAYYNNRRIDTDNSSKYFKTKNLVPEVYIPQDRRFTFLVKPLFFKNEHFGFVVFEVENDDVLHYEVIRGQISNTLKGALMLTEREKMEENLREQDRLASLGQLIGGISHNFNTPIMSVSGICVGFEDLVKEYKDSIGDNSVTSQDYYEIAHEMSDWLNKLNNHVSYMSDIITNIQRQAAWLNVSTTQEFNVDELVNGIKFFVNSDLKIKKCRLNFHIDVALKTKIKGSLPNLVQVMNNLIVNAFQSYEGTDDNMRKIDFKIYREENYLTLAVKDYGAGIPEHIKSKIFKQMVTTKGKNGTGLSLLLSHSTIHGKFKGELSFESTPDQGTEFSATIPLT